MGKKRRDEKIINDNPLIDNPLMKQYFEQLAAYMRSIDLEGAPDHDKLARITFKIDITHDHEGLCTDAGFSTNFGKPDVGNKDLMFSLANVCAAMAHLHAKALYDDEKEEAKPKGPTLVK